MTLPYPRSYWVLEGRLLAGYYPGEKNVADAERKLTALLDLGARTFVNLMEVGESGRTEEPFVPYEPQLRELASRRGADVALLRFPIRDVTAPSRELMARILDAVDAALAAGQVVYVHCRGGIGRTGTVVGCYLRRHGLASAGDVLARVRELRRADPASIYPFPQGPEQGQLVLTWEEGT